MEERSGMGWRSIGRREEVGWRGEIGWRGEVDEGEK
jgi:hypothetical protein